MWFVQTAWVAPCQRAPGSIAGLPFPTSMRPRRVGGISTHPLPAIRDVNRRAFRDRHGIAHRVTVEDNVPSSLMTLVLSFVMGLSVRTSRTSARPVIVSPAERCLETPIHLKEYRARPREVFGHDRVRIALVTPPCTTISPNRLAFATASS